MCVVVSSLFSKVTCGGLEEGLDPALKILKPFLGRADNKAGCGTILSAFLVFHFLTIYF